MNFRGRTLLLFLICLSAAPASLSASGEVLGRVADGYQVSVDTRWSDAGGYRPVEVSLLPVAPLAADAVMTVEFTVESQYFHQDRITVSQDVVVSSGTPTTAKATLSVPQTHCWEHVVVRFYEDGNLLRNLTLDRYLNNEVQFIDGVSSLLILADGRNVYRSTMHQQGFVDQWNGYQQGYISSQTVSLDRLPKVWLNYSSVDVLCATREQLQQLIKDDPQTWRAIRSWIAAGGNLWVYGLEQDWSDLPKLEQLLELHNADSSELDPKKRGWNQPTVRSFEDGSVSDESFTIQRAPKADVIRTRPGEPTQKPKSPVQVKTALVREWGLGQLVAVALKEPPTDGDQNTLFWNRWRQVYSAVGGDRTVWYRRFGVGFDYENEEFWDFLIPGVGKPPLIEFQVLITLFVLFIGPVNYIFLRRKRRLHLLVVSVPLFAFLVMASLFGYALIADGLGVRVRARTLTDIDQRSDQAACWSRLSYFAGLAPSQGLVFSRDVAVVPFFTNENQNRRDLRIRWDQRQHLASGWIRARNPTQLITVRSRPTQQELIVVPASKTGDPPEVTNRLGCRIQHLLLCNEAGAIGYQQDLAAGATARLSMPGDVSLQASAMQRLFMENRPRVPEGFDPNSASSFSTRRRIWWGRSTNIEPPSQSTSRLEEELRKIETDLRSARMKPRTYLAIVDRSPEVEFGVEEPEEESSFHVIRGRW